MDITRKVLLCAILSLSLVACGRNEQSPNNTSNTTEKNAVEVENETVALQEKAIAQEKAAMQEKMNSANKDAEDMLKFLLVNDRYGPINICNIKNLKVLNWMSLSATHHEQYGQLERPIKAVIGKVKFTCGMPMSAEGTDMEFYISGAHFPEYEKVLCGRLLREGSRDKDDTQEFINIVKSCKYEPVSFKKEEGGDVHFCTESNCNINDFLPK